MSRLTGAYDLGRFTGTCAATGAALAPGAACVTALCESSSDGANAGAPSGLGLRRLDYSIAAWDAGSRPNDLLFFWRTTVPSEDGRRTMLVDDETLLDLVQRLESDDRPQRIAFRFVLTLLLIRKKLLRVVGQRREDGPAGDAQAREHWLVQIRGVDSSAPPFAVLNPRLHEDDVRDIAAQLGEIMQGAL